MTALAFQNYYKTKGSHTLAPHAAEFENQLPLDVPAAGPTVSTVHPTPVHSTDQVDTEHIAS